MEKMTKQQARFKRRVEDLPVGVLRKLSLLLNPRMVCGGDWQSLAGLFKMKYIEILNYGREVDPTMAILPKWWSEPGDKSVSKLISLLKELKREDACKLLEDFEFCDSQSDQSQPSDDGSVQSKENDEEERALTSNGMPSRMPVSNDFSNGYDERFNDTCSSSTFEGGSSISSKSQPKERHLDHASYAIGGYPTVEPDSQDELEDSSGMYQGRGSRRKIAIADTSVQTQVPSPTIGNEAPSFPSPAEESTDGFNVPKQLTAPHDKIALVIGNLNYEKKSFDKLAYTMNDAYDMAGALCDLNFKVISMVDLSLTEMRTSMLAFCRLLGPGIYAVIYYAGHGYELNGENYLLPVDAVSSDTHQCIRAQEFLQEMQSCNTLLNLMFLDCCRTRAKDQTSPRCSLKRNTNGNTIIAYSCCTQHEAFEVPNEKNGIYARHLLKHIKRNDRIEHILMNVSSAVVESRSVDQRPTYESDAYLDCRLTAPIIPEPEGTKMQERHDLWHEGSRLPETIEADIGDAILTLEFKMLFNNLMHIDLFITNNRREPMRNCRVKICLPEPLKAELSGGTTESFINVHVIEPSPQAKHIGWIKISRLQKLYNETIFASIDIETDDEMIVKKFDFGRPLISGITGAFHEWIKDRKYETPSGGKSSWI